MSTENTTSAANSPRLQSELQPGSLHVAMVVRSFSERGGLELYAHRTVEGLLERGHKVTVICEENNSPFEHKDLRKIFFEKSAKKARKAIRIQQHFAAATKTVKESGPFDIIHSQHLPMEGANVVSFHNHTAARLIKVGQGWERLLTRAKMIYSTAYKTRLEQDRILCRAPVLLFPAAVMRDDFRETYALDNTHDLRSYVIANPGANFPQKNEISQDAKRNQENTPFTFLFVGKGYRKKGLDILLSACHNLKSEQVQFRLLIAGLKAKSIDKLRLQLSGLSQHVQYLGFRHDMDAVYAQAQATVLPSRIEPFGMAPVQGMLFGLVPIVSRVTGVSEVLSDGIDALILQNHLSVEELSQLMRKLISDAELTRSLSAKARATADMLTWSRTVDATLHAYDVCMAKR